MNREHFKLLILLIATLFGAQVAMATNTPFAIDERDVDVFLPAPAISDDCYQLQRSYQPFGESSAINFDTAVVHSGEASVRLTSLKLDGQRYWLDFILTASGSNVVLAISNYGTNSPPESLPYGGDYSGAGIDFSLTSAEIFGPPARIRLFDVAINYVLYDFDFTWLNDQFVLTGSTHTGFMNAITTPDDNYILFAGQANPTIHDGDTNSSLILPLTTFQTPMAIFWDGEDGEHSIRMQYKNGSRVQTMFSTDGVLRGNYLPPAAQAEYTLYSNRTAQTSWLAAWWSNDVSEEEKLDQCIKKKTALFVGLKADPQLSAQLVDTVFSVAGSLSLSSSTLDKLRDTIADSKDLVLEMMANGEVDSTTLAIFVSSTIMKNATPQEHQQIIERIWGNNVPSDVAAMAQSAGAAETNSKLAMQALAEGIASHAFPAFTAAVKLVQKTANYAKDTLGNDAFRELYDVYKNSGGNWDDVNLMSVLATNKFADSTIREILKSRGENHSDAAIENYLKSKMENLYARGDELEDEREKLNGYKDDYLNMSTSMKLDLKNKNYSSENPTTCEMFHKYLDIRSRIELDLKTSSRNCEEGLTITEIQNQAEFLARYWTRPASSANKADYQAAKLNWLQRNNCLNFDDVVVTTPTDEHGVWTLKETIVWIYPDINSHACYESSAVISDGSYSSTTSVSPDVCNWDYAESYTANASWISPPATLVPGESYPAGARISRSNAVDQWGASDYVYMYMDNYETACGYVTASEVDINTEALKVGWRDSDPASAEWSGTFVAPSYGYAGSAESKQFQIKAGGRAGCVRYIYEWQE
ncbi:MAG: hypothetical protein RBR22_01295 [Desulfuromonas sp.]|nr:hypothetical protein [Desulfuromonas sp.]